MKILCLVDAFLPDHTGGITKSLLPAVEGLANLGHHITVVSKRLYKNTPHYEVKTNYDFYRYLSPHKSSIFYRLYPLFSLTTLPRLLVTLHRQYNFDIAYVHDPFQAYALSKALPDLPYVYSYHASVYSEINLDAAKGKYGLLNPLIGYVNIGVKNIEYKALKKANQIVVDSQFMRSDLCNLYQDIQASKILHIPLCVDHKRFFYAENQAAIRQKLALSTETPILLTVRRLVARMGLENIIKAMEIVAKKFPEVLLLIGGTGYLKNTLQESINKLNLEQNVKMLGFIPEDALPEYYQAADLFILPTLAYEGFGVVTIESLACGTPVMATPVGASQELLSPLGQEFLFSNNTVEAIAEGINYWLEQGFNTTIRQRCLSYFVDHFSQDRICQELQKVLLDVSQERKSY